MTYNWKPVIKSLLKHLANHGFSPSSVDNGEGKVRTATWGDAVEEIVATDESNLYVVHPNYEKKAWIFVVLGNMPEETICDCSAIPELDKVMDDFSKEWEGKPCPVKN